MTLADSLAARWPLSGHHEVRNALLAAYAGPGRAYHDLRHLAEVLDRLDELAAAGEELDRTTVPLAAWFHDAVYDGRPGAEERSARWALQALPGGLGAAVARLVRMTADHRADDADGAALCDADLGVLAAPPARYREYVADVRREYAHLDDATWRAGRSAVLTGLLDRPALFSTGHGRERWEAAARANVRAELDALDAPGG